MEEEPDMGFWSSVRNVVTGEKAANVTTPPMQKIKPKYGDKKIVKAKNPKKKS
jgi:hypothetical protein